MMKGSPARPARHVVIAPIEPWCWRAAAWGAAFGFIAGMFVTVGLAWIWSFYL